MINHNTLLLIVDPQNDFCNPQGALYVPGAEEDMSHLARFIDKNNDFISRIILTRDQHQVIDISHPAFWSNNEGAMPPPFTPVSLADLRSHKWIPLFFSDEVEHYLEQLELQGEMSHVIWPEHCLAGSWGAAFNDDVMNAVTTWARKGRFYSIVSKGQNPLTEHFGAIRANVVIAEDPGTEVNEMLVEELKQADTIIIAGEARSHCVANTLKQIMEQPSVKGEILLLTDCMSDVAGMGKVADPIYEEAVGRGIRFTDSASLYLERLYER